MKILNGTLTKYKIKTSVRFFRDYPVRSVWDDESSKWWFCACDVVGALTETKNPRVYWATLKRRNSELFTNCKQLKLTAKDGKKYKTDVISENELNILLVITKSKSEKIFREWISYIESSLDDKSKLKAYELFESGIINKIEIGTIKGLQQIHAYIFAGLYDFAGKIRTKNISKGGFMFASVEYLVENLKKIEAMPENSLANIVKKYVEMNIAHPFMEGNGRSTRIWLDLILKKNLSLCVDWSLIDKKSYLEAMEKSPIDDSLIINLISKSLTDKINDRETFMKGVDYSYYYESDN
ncbi:MAG: Fic family protein [Synergistaceae bacterium]|nr:Fic family protein [Synergistaceae bacterium]